MGWRITDDAGRRINVLDGAYGESWPLKSDARLRTLVRRARSASRGGVLGQLCVSLAIPAVVVVVLGELGFLSQGCAMWLIGLCGVSVSIAHVCRRRARSEGRVAELVLEEGMCAGCGYNLVGLKREALVHCPECGACWKSRRILRAEEACGAEGLTQPSLVIFDADVEQAVEFEDDRGACCWLDLPGRRSSRGSQHASVDWKECRRQVFARTHRLRLFVGGALAVPWILWVVWQSAAPGSSITEHELELPVMLVATLGLMFLGALVASGVVGVRAGDIRATMLEHGRCPSCSMSLRGLVADPADGCVRCSTCRAAWRWSGEST